MVGDVCDAAAARYSSPEAVKLQQEQQQQEHHQQEQAASGEDADSLLAAALTVPALAEVCDKNAVLSAIGCDKRIGPLCLRPGYGFGGPCFPRDNRAFATVSSGLGVQPLLPRATDEANGVHAATQARQFSDLRHASYTFRDVAYKPGCPTPLIEESQKLRVAALLADTIRTRASSLVPPQQDGGGCGHGGVIVADRRAVLDAVRLSYGSKFSYHECD
jgi:UDPglucose 6-dehydrogenase